MVFHQELLKTEMVARNFQGAALVKSSNRASFIAWIGSFFFLKTRCLACIAASLFRASLIYVVEETKNYIDRKRPTIDALMAVVHKWHAYAFSKIEFVYPIVRSWMLFAGRLMLLFLMVWLNCNMRGFDSLLKLGTNSLLSVLWCSTLSIFALIGIKKMLIFTVIAASAVAFIGLGFAILLISVFVVVILWFYVLSFS